MRALNMRNRLQRFYGQQHAHFITCSCYRRQPLLDSDRRKDLFLAILEEVRRRYQFYVFGYVVMPEHFHLLVSEPKRNNLSIAMQVLKRRVSLRVRQRRCRTASCRQDSFLALTPSDAPHFWQPRFYDFNVFTRRKFIEKLRYIHRNPVTRGLVRQPDQWRWSSFRFYAYGEKGPVQVDYDLPQREPEPVFREPKS